MCSPPDKGEPEGVSAKLRALDKQLVWHPFTQMAEWAETDNIVIESGNGSYLVDTDGRRYLDGTASLWVNVHGHRKKELDDAIKRQIDRISHSTLLGLANVPSIELAQRLMEVVPKGLEKVFYSDNGSTAVEIALKLAFQYWEQTQIKNRKRKFIAFTGAYHGDTFGSMSVGEIDIFVKKYRPLLFDCFRSPYPYCYRCPIGKTPKGCGLACLGVFEEILKKHHLDIAACVIEPLLQGAAGMITNPKGFLKEVRRLTTKYDVLLIADEVATGFGRTGSLFACDKERISPDILCLAKGLTGGYLPLAATLTTKRIYDAFLGDYSEYKSFFHGHTYTGNPLGCAAAIANIDLFKKERIIERLKPKVKLFASLLKKFNGLAHVGDVRHIGLCAGIELVKDKKTKEPFGHSERIGHRVCMEARQHGLIIRPLGDTIVIMPPLAIKDTELKKMTAIVYECISLVAVL
ncbi:MAG: adenosylmethionine--8-amino-7-oxononanoate transaminase [Deltaproteobacteria bacterium RIFCSPLOWO2_02_FULL_53_8]|nr:MAG: adenosylmethionine--8-amino-7-oxononanoate transaminase [Deltaproteobacteria bacterium RIFCSPLOWO2_02_FULL_53_8]